MNRWVGRKGGQDLQYLVAALLAINHDVAARTLLPTVLLADVEDTFDVFRGPAAFSSGVGGFQAGDAGDGVALGAAGVGSGVLAHGDKLGACLHMAVHFDLAADLLSLGVVDLEELGVLQLLDGLGRDIDAAARGRENGHALRRRLEEGLETLVAVRVCAVEANLLVLGLILVAADARLVH